jgi:GT2 family glycosyltransferase
LSDDATLPSRLVVGIATYNGRALLEIVLPSVARQTFKDRRVVVVDDASSDDTVVWLARHWPDVELIRHECNRGVTASLNDCLDAGQSEFVVLLNNDLELDQDCLTELVSALEAHPEAGSACGKLIDYRRRDHLDGAGDIYTWGGEANRRGHGEPDNAQYDRAQEIFSASAALAVYRRSALQDIGLFDEHMFAFYEDVDWGFRAQLAGWSCRYVPSAVAYHIGSATLGKGPSDFVLYQNWRNAIWTVIKNYPASALLCHAPALAFVQARNLAIALRRCKGLVWLRAWRDALAGLRAVLRARRRVQRLRVRSLAELDRSIRSR